MYLTTLSASLLLSALTLLWTEKPVWYLMSARFGHGMIFSKLWFAYNKTKQGDIYEKFLDFLREASPGIGEVENAEKRSIGLRSQ